MTPKPICLLVCVTQIEVSPKFSAQFPQTNNRTKSNCECEYAPQRSASQKFCAFSVCSSPAQWNFAHGWDN